MNVSFALVRTISVPVRVMRVAHRSVIVLVGVTGVQVIETTGHLVVVVSHVKVVVSMSQSLVLVMLPVSGRSVVRHIHSRCLSPAGEPAAPFIPHRGDHLVKPVHGQRPGGRRDDRPGAPR